MKTIKPFQEQKSIMCQMSNMSTLIYIYCEQGYTFLDLYDSHCVWPPVEQQEEYDDVAKVSSVSVTVALQF